MTRALAYAGLACAVLAFAVAMCTGVTIAATVCEDTDPCYAEPSPLPRVYVPLVAREVPAMSAEFTPVHPAPTVTPEVSGDVAR